MKLVDGDATIIVVTGGSAAALERDGPLAAWLAEEVDRRGGGIRYHHAVVLPDSRFVQSPVVHRNPTIAVGGPGANQVAHHLSQVLPTVWNQDEESFVQLAPGDGGRQAAIWGMNAAATRRAVEAFVAGGMLDDLLERVWNLQNQPLM